MVAVDGVGQVAGSAASVVVRPVQPVVQQQLVINAVNMSMPVFSQPNFPTIHQALLGAAHEPATTVATSAVATVTASVVPDPAVIKTLLASKLARNMTQQQSDMNCSQGTSTITSSVSSVPSCSSLTCVSAADSPSPSPLPAVTCAADVDVAAKDNHVSAAGHVTPSAGEVDSSISDKADNSNGLTVTDDMSSMPVTLASSCTVSSTVTASSCLANGHAKQFHDPSVLMNGICSPVPSCSSEDQEPPRDVKVPKSPGCDNKCDGPVVNGDVVDNEADDDDDDDDGSDLDDCDGDVLVKAMMRADIIDCGGRPAITDNSCDDDSRMSTDFLSGYIESAGEHTSNPDIDTSNQVSGADTGIGFDSETAAAVADLLHETGMMADDETTASNMSVSGNDNCVSYEDDVTVSAADNQCVIAATADMLSLPAPDETLTSATTDDSSVTATGFDQQLDCHSSSADVTQQTLAPLDVKAEPLPLVGLSSTSTALDRLAVPALTCSGNAAGASLPVPSSSATPTQLPVSSVTPTAQLQNGVMVVPPHGISLPSGQFISGGTRLMIRPITSVPQAANNTPSLSVRLNQPTLPTAIQPVLNAQSGSAVASTSSSSVVDSFSQLPVSNVTVSTSAPAVRFVSSTTSQGQLIIQRAQILTSTNSPLIQRVVVPHNARPIAMRSEGQMILQATQPNQQIASRPVLFTQAPFPAGQLRVAGPSMQLVTGSSAHAQSTPTQIVLQSGHVISVQPQQPSAHDVSQANQSSGQVQIAAANNFPVLAAKPSLDQQQNQSTSSQATGDGAQSSNQSVIQGTGPQLSTSVKPSLRPLMSTSQQPVQIVGGPVQLRAGLVGLPTGSGNASVILQHGGRPILLQSPNVGTAQHPSSYVVFRPGPLPVQSSQEHTDSVAVSSATTASSSSSPLAPDVMSRKRPLPATSANVTRPVRKKTKKDEDCGLSFMCEWSSCQRCLFITLLFVAIAL